VRKYTVIIPAAGKGTRFSPFSLLVPKEMVPIMQYPAIEYIAREYEKSGITEIVLVINESKQMIIEYVKKVRKKSSNIRTVFQEKSLGLGHAVLQAHTSVSGNYVAIILPDDIIFSQTPVIQQLCKVSEKYEASAIAIKKVAEDKVSSYGMVAISQEIEPGVFIVESIVEKPLKQDAPSCYAIIGRYVLDKGIFEALSNITPGAKAEYQLTDGMNLLLQQKKKIFAVLFEGDHFDVGTPESWAQAVAYCAKNGGNESILI
jgi:UTP--glucose-1-phosphate uridylyltransferase